MKYDLIHELTCQFNAILKDGLWGVVDKQGNEILAIQFDRCPEKLGDWWNTELAICFRCQKDGKVGVFEPNNKQVLPIIYDDVKCLKTTFLVTQGEEKRIVDIETGCYCVTEYEVINEIANKHYIVQYKQKYGIINNKGELIVPIIYKDLTMLDNVIVMKHGIREVSIFDIRTSKIVYSDKNVLVDVITGDCIALYKKCYAICNFTLSSEVEYKYDAYTKYDYPSMGKWIYVQSNNKYGILNYEGKEVIPPIYDEIKSLKNNHFVVCKNGKYGVLNIEGEELLPCEYQQIENFGYGGKYTKVLQNDKFGLMGPEYNLIIPTIYHYIEMVSDRHARVGSRGFLYGLYDVESGKILCDLRYKDIENFCEGYACVHNIAGLYGYINERGEEIIPCKYSAAVNFCNGYARVSKNTGNYGYIDTKGREVTKFIYYIAADVTKDGLAQVSYRERGKERDNYIPGIIYLDSEEK